MEPVGRRRPGLCADLPKQNKREEDEEEKEEADYDEEEMEGKMGDEQEMQDSLVVEEGMLIKFPLVLFNTFLFPLQFPLHFFLPFYQEEVKQPHCRDTQRPNIINYLGPPDAPDHL